MQTCTRMCKSESWSELCSHCAALHCLSTMKFDLMQKLAKPAGSMHQTRQGLSLCMAVISLLGTAKGDEENWAFRFQRLTNVCRPRRRTISSRISFFTNWSRLGCCKVYILYCFVLCLLLCISREFSLGWGPYPSSSGTIGSCVCASAAKLFSRRCCRGSGTVCECFIQVWIYSDLTYFVEV